MKQYFLKILNKNLHKDDLIHPNKLITILYAVV